MREGVPTNLFVGNGVTRTPRSQACFITPRSLSVFPIKSATLHYNKLDDFFFFFFWKTRIGEKMRLRGSYPGEQNKLSTQFLF